MFATLIQKALFTNACFNEVSAATVAAVTENFPPHKLKINFKNLPDLLFDVSKRRHSHLTR